MIKHNNEGHEEYESSKKILHFEHMKLVLEAMEKLQDKTYQKKIEKNLQIGQRFEEKLKKLYERLEDAD